MSDYMKGVLHGIGYATLAMAIVHFALALLFSKQSNIWLEIYGESIIINLLDSS